MNTAAPRGGGAIQKMFKRLLLPILLIVAIVFVVYSVSKFGIESTALMISAMTMMAVAFFTWKTWEISARQYDWTYKKELYLYPETFTVDFQYGCTLVNPSSVPVVVVDIKEKLELYDNIEGLISSDKLNPGFDIPTERNPNIFIDGTPWVISGKSFAVWSRKLFKKETSLGKVIRFSMLKKKKSSIKCIIKYHHYEKKKLFEKEIEIPIPER